MSSSGGSGRASRYRIRLTPRALRDVELICGHLRRETDGDLAAERWLEELLAAIEGLSSYPRRFPTAPEDRVLLLGLRQRVLGDYRILYLVREEPREAHVLHVRHAKRAAAERHDLE